MGFHDEYRLLDVAMAAYSRSGRQSSKLGVRPSASDSSCVEHNGNSYIVLRDGHCVLAVYRVRSTGALRRLKRWPEALNGAS